MASPVINPAIPPSPGGAPLNGSAPVGAPGSAPTPQGGDTAQSLARLAMDAQRISADAPETAPMMREVQNQVRMATMKMIQQRQQAQQVAPAI